jgi:hypothetical protein
MPVIVADAQPTPARDVNPNPFFATVAAGLPEIADAAALPIVSLRPTVTVDFPTTASATYTLTPAP